MATIEDRTPRRHAFVIHWDWKESKIGWNIVDALKSLAARGVLRPVAYEIDTESDELCVIVGYSAMTEHEAYDAYAAWRDEEQQTWDFGESALEFL